MSTKKAIEDIVDRFRGGYLPDTFTSFMSIEFLEALWKRNGDTKEQIKETIDRLYNGEIVEYESGITLQLTFHKGDEVSVMCKGLRNVNGS